VNNRQVHLAADKTAASRGGGRGGNKKVISRSGSVPVEHQQLHEYRPLERCLLEMISAILTNVGLVELVLLGAIIYWLFGKSTRSEF